MTGPDPKSTDELSGSGLSDFKARIGHQIREYLYRAIKYLLNYVFAFIVFSGALLLDYGLLTLAACLVRDEVETYPIVAVFFDYTRIGLAFMSMIGMVAHGTISTVYQIRLDLSLSKEGEHGA